jgi:hypothetical protein
MLLPLLKAVGPRCVCLRPNSGGLTVIPEMLSPDALRPITPQTSRPANVAYVVNSGHCDQGIGRCVVWHFTQAVAPYVESRFADGLPVILDDMEPIVTVANLRSIG